MNRERVFVVDENDLVIGEKWRDELTDDDCWRVVSIWITDLAGNILLQQRSLNKKVGPGIWSAACEGTVEANDSEVETAIRELEEEIGVQANDNELKPTTKIHYKDPQFGWRYKYGYSLEIEHIPAENFTIQESEVSQVRWFTPKELTQFIKENPRTFVLENEYRALGFIN